MGAGALLGRTDTQHEGEDEIGKELHALQEDQHGTFSATIEVLDQFFRSRQRRSRD